MITAGTNMKKILLTLTCALLLTGCLAQEPVEQQDNKPSETETQNDEQNTNENQQNSENGSENSGQNNDDDNNNQDPGDNTPSSQGEPTQDIRTKNVTFKDGSFIGQLDQPSARDNFVSYINGTDDLLSSISFVGKSESKEVSFETLVDGEKKSEKHIVWWLGSSSTNGVLTMNFKYDVTKISLSIQAYYKSYVDTWSQSEAVVVSNVDTTAKMYVDTQDNVKDLSCPETEVPQVVSFSKNYETPTKQIILGTFEAYERVYIHSMELTYIHE